MQILEINFRDLLKAICVVFVHVWKAAKKLDDQGKAEIFLALSSKYEAVEDGLRGNVDEKLTQTLKSFVEDGLKALGNIPSFSIRVENNNHLIIANVVNILEACKIQGIIPKISGEALDILFL